MRIAGMMVVGPNEADRYLKASLEELKRLCDYVYICCNNADDKTKEMVASYGFKWYEDERVWGKDQPRIKQDLLSFVGRGNPDWVVAIDADEVFDPRFNRSDLEALCASKAYAFYVYVVNLWDDGYRKDMSFWNVRLFKYPETPEERLWENKALHCGLAPRSSYHRGSYAPVFLLHRGLMEKENRMRKVERYKTFDPKGEFKDASFYKALAWEGKPDPFDPDFVRQEVIEEVARMKQPNKEKKPMAMQKSKKYVFLQREDGEVIDIPYEHLASTLKLHPLWVVVREVIPGADEPSQYKNDAPPVVADPLECGLCGFIGKNDLSLKMHKQKSHAV